MARCSRPPWRLLGGLASPAGAWGRRMLEHGRLRSGTRERTLRMSVESEPRVLQFVSIQGRFICTPIWFKMPLCHSKVYRPIVVWERNDLSARAQLGGSSNLNLVLHLAASSPTNATHNHQMTTSRAESVHSQYGRRRSNTSQSIARVLPPPPPPPPPLKYGSSKVLNAWVHEVKDSPSIALNHAFWPGVAEGDLLRITTAGSNEGFLFSATRDELQSRTQLQVSNPSLGEIPISRRVDIGTQADSGGAGRQDERRGLGDQGALVCYGSVVSSDRPPG